MQPRSYLDHNATAPVRPEVAEAVARALEVGGNPSSVHAEGRAARALVEEAREAVAALVSARARNVIFTSGGTEAVALALAPGARRSAGVPPADRLVTLGTEHPCVLDGHRFEREQVVRVRVDGRGVADRAALTESTETGCLVSIQLANSETGVIQPAAELAAALRERCSLIHSDAVQAAGRVPVVIGSLGVDVLSLSAHKLGGPKGVGALVLADESVELGAGLLRGGGQERNRRAGTENVPGIAGFGVAALAAARELEREAVRLGRLRDAALAALRRAAPDAMVFGEEAERLPNTLCFAVPGVRAETALIAFDLAGLALSSGSACTSGKVRRSHVLAAMGVAEGLAAGALRLSLGWNSTEIDVERFAAACETVFGTLYRGRADAA